MSKLIISKHDDSSSSANVLLANKLLNLNETQIVKQSHFFEGRYENIYVDIKQFSKLEQIIVKAKEYAAEILNQDPDRLKIGFWINIMQQGHTTTLHRHDDDDELLSGVYYLKVPQASGQFVFYPDGEKQEEVKPEEGSFLFFSPALLHKVTEHKSKEPRISIAFNIGPVNPEEID